MQHVVRADIIVIANIHDGAVGRIYGNRDISSRALQSEKSVKVELDVLCYTDSCFTVAAVHE